MVGYDTYPTNTHQSYPGFPPGLRVNPSSRTFAYSHQAHLPPGQKNIEVGSNVNSKYFGTKTHSIWVLIEIRNTYQHNCDKAPIHMGLVYYSSPINYYQTQDLRHLVLPSINNSHGGLTIQCPLQVDKLFTTSGQYWKKYIYPPSLKLTYPTLRKGKSSSKSALIGNMYSHQLSLCSPKNTSQR